MKSFVPSNKLGRGLMLMSAGILICANGAFAAQSGGDAQMQASDLLSGTVGARANTVDVASAVAADDGNTVNIDPQDQARDLLLGASNFSSVTGGAASIDSTAKAMPVVYVRDTRRADDGGQESAQRMLLGKGV
jgi:hypothetical protein